jgi:hypothetical protein
MSDAPVVFLGDTWSLPFQILQQDAALPVATAVRAALVHPQTSALLVGPVDCDPGHAEAQPAQGKFVAVFPAASIAAAGVQRGTVLLEVEIADLGTWERRLLRVEQGAIP